MIVSGTCILQRGGERGPEGRGPRRKQDKELTSDADTEVIAMMLANVLDEIGSVLELIARGYPVLLAARRVCVSRRAKAGGQGDEDQR